METDEMKQKLKEWYRVSWFISAQLFMEIRDFFSFWWSIVDMVCILYFFNFRH
jgi:hypothetical protein